VYWFLPGDAYFAIADEAKTQRIEFSGHVPVVVSAAEASDAGQRTIEHNDGILRGCSAKEAEWLTRDRNSLMPGRQAEMLQAYDDARCEALGRRFAKNGTWLVPTAVNFNDPPDVELDSRRRYVLPTERERWTNAIKSRRASRESRAPLAVLRRERNRQMMQAMHRAGVRFMAGTDLSSRDGDGFRRPFHIPGVGLHDELALFVNNGFTPAEALQTATSNVSDYAGVRDAGSRKARRHCAARCQSSGGHSEYTKDSRRDSWWPTLFPKRVGRHGRPCGAGPLTHPPGAEREGVAAGRLLLACADWISAVIFSHLSIGSGLRAPKNSAALTEARDAAAAMLVGHVRAVAGCGRHDGWSEPGAGARSTSGAHTASHDGGHDPRPGSANAVAGSR
jgi:hypothetical protein